jgi:zinc D-Ala-D-Ala carboxypeptidase
VARFFRLEELACKCGRPACDAAPVSPELLGRLDRAREIAGVPFRVTSGTRCAAHNASVGGSADSAHLDGLAADIVAGSGLRRFAIVQAAIVAGFDRVGVARGFVHLDVCTRRPRGVLWTY